MQDLRVAYHDFTLFPKKTVHPTHNKTGRNWTTASTPRSVLKHSNRFLFGREREHRRAGSSELRLYSGTFSCAQVRRSGPRRACASGPLLPPLPPQITLSSAHCYSMLMRRPIVHRGVDTTVNLARYSLNRNIRWPVWRSGFGVASCEFDSHPGQVVVSEVQIINCYVLGILHIYLNFTFTLHYEQCVYFKKNARRGWRFGQKETKGEGICWL